jgi:hypothetical protein
MRVVNESGMNDPACNMELRDWIGIQQLVGRYVDAIDRHDPEAWAECWARQVVMADGRVVSREEKVQDTISLWKRRNPQEPFRHLITNSVILDFSPGEARMRVAIAWVQFREGTYRFLGHYAYDDELIYEDGYWRYRQRRIGQFRRVIGHLSAEDSGY